MKGAAGLIQGLVNGAILGQMMRQRETSEVRAQAADTRSQEQHELMKRLRTLGVAHAERDAADQQAYRDAAARSPQEPERAPRLPTASLGVLPAGASAASSGEAGVPSLDTSDGAATGDSESTPRMAIGKKTYYGQLDAVLKAAQERGDLNTVQRLTKTMDTLETEGMRKVTQAVLVGQSPEEIERIFNSTGTHRIRPGSVSVGSDGKLSAVTEDGSPYVFNAPLYARLTGMTKEAKAHVVKPGDELWLDGKKVATNTAGLAARLQNDLVKLDYEYDLKKKLKTYGEQNGAEKTTALVSNIGYLVRANIATTPKQAFEMLRTTMQKPDEDAVVGLAGNLIRGGSYRGKDGPARAVRDASEIIRTLRTGKFSGASAPGADGTKDSTTSTFGAAEDVRAAFRAGKIDRATAKRELQQNFGLE